VKHFDSRGTNTSNYEYIDIHTVSHSQIHTDAQALVHTDNDTHREAQAEAENMLLTCNKRELQWDLAHRRIIIIKHHLLIIIISSSSSIFLHDNVVVVYFSWLKNNQSAPYHQHTVKWCLGEILVKWSELPGLTNTIHRKFFRDYPEPTEDSG